MVALAGIAVYVLVATACLAALRSISLDGEPHLPRPAPSAVALWLVVAVPSLLQLAVPGLLGALMRDWPRIRSGEVWRLVTSPLVQDGGPVATVSNLVLLAAVGVVGTEYWGAARTWATFWGGAVAANVVVAGVEPTGAGSSMATLVVACAMTSRAVVDRATRARALPPAVGVVVSFVVLAVVGDYHAVACLVGFVAGLPPGRRRPT